MTALKQLPDVPTVPLFDVPLARVDYGQVVDLVNQWLLAEDVGALAGDAINAMGLAESCRDARMREALKSYDLLVPDGMPLVWCMNAKGAGLVDRVYGPYLVEKILTALPRRTRIAVVGGSRDVHERLVRMSETRFPRAEYVVLHDTSMHTIDERSVTDCLVRVHETNAELIFVCLGVPRQYYWVEIARPRLNRGVCLSVGGAFDLITGKARYAPAWMQRAGLTWLHRLVRNPTRLAPRYLRYNPMFVWYLLTREIVPGKLRPVRRSSSDVNRKSN
jgi:N-acetylglucosaminyldiphosphoundecaprenol N-acetyl-beta-D-mannosaminyltransferase